MLSKPQYNRVVITGLSAVSPLGNSLADLSQAVFGGVSGIKRIDMPFVDQLSCKIAAQSNFDPADYFTKHTYSISLRLCDGGSIMLILLFKFMQLLLKVQK